VYLEKEDLKEQHVHNKCYCNLGEKATGIFKMFKIASGGQRMGTANFLENLQVQKQCDLRRSECLEHPSMSNRDESVDGVKILGVKDRRTTIY
jgi:hypothetical protein